MLVLAVLALLSVDKVRISDISTQSFEGLIKDAYISQRFPVILPGIRNHGFLAHSNG
jgi:hypothetical protein